MRYSRIDDGFKLAYFSESEVADARPIKVARLRLRGNRWAIEKCSRGSLLTVAVLLLGLVLARRVIHLRHR